MIHIVSIDDTETNNVVIEFDLEEYFDSIQEEHKFKSFTEPKAGLVYLEGINNRVDILFLDLMMPDMDGFELLSKLRANDSISQPYVIVVSALSDEESKKRAKDLGADAYISKPFDVAEIHKAIEDYLNSNDTLNKASLEQSNEHDQFFDEDGFIDFDDFFDDETGGDQDATQKEIIETLNATHNGYDAVSFHEDLLSALDEETYQDILSDFYQILEDIDEISEINRRNIKKQIDSYNAVISKISLLMETLGTEFVDLGYSFSISKHFLDKIHGVHDEEKLDIISTFLVAFLDEISRWIENVFIKKDAIDVCYANASFHYSLMQIEELLKEH